MKIIIRIETDNGQMLLHREYETKTIDGVRTLGEGKEEESVYEEAPKIDLQELVDDAQVMIDRQNF